MKNATPPSGYVLVKSADKKKGTSVEQKNGKNVYYVRDNGLGTVRRIIRRHSGKVWGERSIKKIRWQTNLFYL